MLVSIVLGAILLLIFWILWTREHDPLDDLPGPPKLPIVGNALSFFGVKQDEMFKRIRGYVKTYGDRFLIKVLNRRILQISSPQDIQVVLSHSRNITKSYPYTLLEPWLGNGLLLSTGSKWHQQRKILTPTFHFNILKNFGSVIEEKSRELVADLEKTASTEVELMPLVSDFTLHTICETAMGTRIDTKKSTDIAEYKSAILSIGALAMKRLTTVWLHNPLVFSLSQTGSRFKEVLGKVHAFVDNVILERKSNWSSRDLEESEALDTEDLGSKRRLAMLDLLLAAEERGEIDLTSVRDEVNTFMFEGHDTTAMAITFGLMLLADHPEVQAKIHEELYTIFGESGNARASSMSDLAEMKYLEAVIKEVLRLYPSVPFLARLITEDFMLGDLKVKKGTEIAVHIYDLHRRPDLFPDPDEFRPERFLEGGLKHPYAFVPFSAGPRNCIGQRFAMQEMKTVLSSVCRSFQLQPVVRGWRPDLIMDMVLRPHGPVRVKFIKR